MVSHTANILMIMIATGSHKVALETHLKRLNIIEGQQKKHLEEEAEKYGSCSDMKWDFNQGFL
jgi:hypothetical protein